MNDCCLIPNKQFSSIRCKNISVTIWWNYDDVCLVLIQHTELGFYSASSLKQ